MVLWSICLVTLGQLAAPERHTPLDTAVAENPTAAVPALSRMGDTHFFRGEFALAVAEYEAMVRLDPAQDESHWRKGIAYFYAGRYEDSAGQFERYHSFDDVDRENGIWRYVAQCKAFGEGKAKAGLLKYRKDDREPFPDVWRLYAGELTAEAVVMRLAAAKLAPAERQKREFYVELYIGLWHAAHDRPAEALPHLQLAAANPWPQTAGYGPYYMSQVARLHAEQIAASGK